MPQDIETKELNMRLLLSTPMPPEPKKPKEKGLGYWGFYKIKHDEWRDLLNRKLAALCYREGIAWNDGVPDWQLLALRLAEMHEPGFRQVKIGRPKSRDSVKARCARRNLLIIVERLAKKRGMTPTAFCEELARRSQRRQLPHFYVARKEPVTASALLSDLTLARRERRQEAVWKERKKRFHPLLWRRRVGQGLGYHSAKDAS